MLLGAVTLNDNMQWAERFHSADVAQGNLRTLGGTQVLYAVPLTGGTNITLIATSDQGWAGLTTTVVEAILAMATTPGATFTLTIGAVVQSVAFRHHEPPAVKFTPILSRVVPDAGDYYTGEIKLVTV
jgi:hypothetical protein